MLLPIQRLGIQLSLKENRRDKQRGKDHERQRQKESPSPRIDSRRLIVIADWTVDGDESLSGHDGGRVDRVVQKRVLHWVHEVGEEGVSAVRV